MPPISISKIEFMYSKISLEYKNTKQSKKTPTANACHSKLSTRRTCIRKESAAARPTSSLRVKSKRETDWARDWEMMGQWLFAKKTHRYCREIMISPFWFRTMSMEIMMVVYYSSILHKANDNAILRVLWKQCSTMKQQVPSCCRGKSPRLGAGRESVLRPSPVQSLGYFFVRWIIHTVPVSDLCETFCSSGALAKFLK